MSLNIKPYCKIKEKIISKVFENSEIEESEVTKPKTKKKFQKEMFTPKTFSGYTPLEIASLYNFPSGDGTGQKVAIIELGGGYILSDITTYLASIGITSTPNIIDVSVDGAVNSPDTSGASFEVALDIEIIVAIVPNAEIRVYFGQNSSLGFYNAISQAITDNCNVISISWGAPEKYWTLSDMSRYNDLFSLATQNNITIFAASGDGGSSDGDYGLNVDFPSSSPFVVACGGTTLVTGNNNIISEVAWNGSGGGISSYFSKPSYQSNIPLLQSQSKRGSPDVSGNADPNSGFKIYMQGSNYIIGGTSAVSPLWSALIARVNQTNGSPVGFLQQRIYYSSSNICSDINSGNNGFYIAQNGWDCCTGWGSPCSSLTQFLNNLTLSPQSSFSSNVTSGQIPLTVQFTDASTNSPTSWIWNFGNGTISNIRNPSITYSNPGNYTVSLTVSNTYGNSTSTKTINVLPRATRPLPKFSALSVNFVDSSLNSPTNYFWNFGDNTTSIEKNPTKNYTKPGTYTVKLTVSNSAGSSSSSKIITLK
jgi:subtilase family serine protease